MKCIYCRKPSTSAQGIAHVFPEAIVKNNIVLPKGSVCDSCNNYLKELDSALIAHNHIWPIIQMAGLPGKKGKPRKKLGYIERSDKDQSLLLNFNQKSIEKITVSEKQIHLQIKNPQNFEDKLFRRALHHVGFNFFALSRQNDSLLAAHFD
ncbi:MAG: hypothetical protein HZB33_04380, partial [Nitrospirae bacterium]|nr:hypothetical protein [Nitrospirota bacterium]